MKARHSNVTPRWWVFSLRIIDVFSSFVPTFLLSPTAHEKVRISWALVSFKIFLTVGKLVVSAGYDYTLLHFDYHLGSLLSSFQMCLSHVIVSLCLPELTPCSIPRAIRTSITFSPLHPVIIYLIHWTCRMRSSWWSCMARRRNRCFDREEFQHSKEEAKKVGGTKSRWRQLFQYRRGTHCWRVGPAFPDDVHTLPLSQCILCTRAAVHVDITGDIMPT